MGSGHVQTVSAPKFHGHYLKRTERVFRGHVVGRTWPAVFVRSNRLSDQLMGRVGSGGYHIDHQLRSLRSERT